MTHRFPVYNQVTRADGCDYCAEIQAESGAGDRRHFRTLKGATTWARRRASEMLTRDHWEPEIILDATDDRSPSEIADQQYHGSYAR